MGLVMAARKGTRPPNAGKGRKPGVPNAVTREVKAAILNAFETVGGEAYLVRVAKKDHKTFCALLGRVLPLQVTGEGGGGLVVKVVRYGKAQQEDGC